METNLDTLEGNKKKTFKFVFEDKKKVVYNPEVDYIPSFKDTDMFRGNVPESDIKGRNFKNHCIDDTKEIEMVSKFVPLEYGRVAKHEICTLIGGNIKKYRTKNNLTQKALGIAIGEKSNGTICLYEQGKASIRAKHLVQIANKLNVKLEQLFEGVI